MANAAAALAAPTTVFAAHPAIRVLAVGVLVLALASIPLFSTVLPPLVDYPNHLARFSLLVAGGNRFYAVRWAPLPNLAGDLVVPLLAHIMPLALAGRVFLTAIFALTLAGAAWLNRMAHGGWRLWPLLAAAAFLYNRPFLWGFVNYLFGLGLALCGAALWLAAERCAGAAWLRVLASSLIAALCFFSHIAAFGVYALLILGLEAAPALRDWQARHWPAQWPALLRRAAIAAGQFVIPAAIVIAWWRPQQSQAQGQISYGAFWRKADLLFTVFDNYNRIFDIACFALLLALLGGLAWRRRLCLAPRLAPALALVLAAYLSLPSQIMTGSGADRRMAVALFLVLAAATAPRFASRRAALLVGGAAAIMLLARLAAIEIVWRTADRAYRADIAAIDALPRGVRLAVAYPADMVNVSAIPELHVPTLAVWRRDAFVPTLFAYPAQQPIAVRPLPDDRDAAAAAATAAVGPALLWSAFVGGDRTVWASAWHALAGWDAVAFVARQPIHLRQQHCLEPLMPQRPTFRIFLLRHDGDCRSRSP